MGLTLKQSNGVQALAKALQDFLPGGGAKIWTGHVNFGTVAASVGVGEFWATQGSKVPRLTNLFERTLTLRSELFERLIVSIVKEGLRYRSGANRVTEDDIRLINGHILEIGFKFPDLWNEGFLASLKLDDPARAAERVAEVRRAEEAKASASAERLRALGVLQTELTQMYAHPNRTEAGYMLEKFLNRLFSLAQLDPRQPFKITGEQIDGSFDLDHDTYLLEAKWEKEPLPQADLLVFRGKIEGKAAFTRGVFVAMNGISEDAKRAILIGKQPTFFVVTGHDLMMIVQGQITLDDFLRRRRRLLAEEAAVCAEFSRVK
ncbi:MAG TPA: hypothetical protein VFK05_29555 [Polyangiaceae bacterium]|nr:hypothetical protein [Polyangiaceae bacterium]